MQGLSVNVFSIAIIRRQRGGGSRCTLLQTLLPWPLVEQKDCATLPNVEVTVICNVPEIVLPSAPHKAVVVIGRVVVIGWY